jgi:DAK2 domain fusion protein YloV
LNVFPVPDGDTGTNMSMSMSTGAKAVADSLATKVSDLAGIFSKGLLMGARGNSGVILSQLFRGFSKSVKDKEVLTARDFAQALKNGVETAYSAVMKPVEGTILTVAKGGALLALKKADQTDNIIEVMEAALFGAKKYLAQTPDLLPVLKEVGVVDSGGQGLVYIYEGFLSSLTGNFETLSTFKPTPAAMDQMIDVKHHRSVADHILSSEIKFGYCTEIMVRLGEGETVDSQFDYEKFRAYLNQLGDSLLVINDENIVKVHVHTETPGKVLDYGQHFGSLVKIKVDNMRLQHDQLVQESPKVKQAPQKPDKIAVIAIAAGVGLRKIFESLGVNFVLAGGQTMNPATEDILNAIQNVNAEQVIILPNNKNIFMAADSALALSPKPAMVVPSKTVQQGITAMLGFNPEETLQDNQAAMQAMLTEVISGQVTIATKDTKIAQITVKKGDSVGLVDGEIVVSNSEIIATSLAVLRKIITEDTEIITIISGENSKEEEISALVSMLEEQKPSLEVEVHEGNQPVYPYLFSAE